ncbi:PadR family transcriptional regulator [Nocardia sp. NPDC059246]|uniref:PadR family transcriptional regulator n=1 Tax=unclassified Nocardia TaxID=2637762 RepID=UPI0036C71510
MVPGDEWRHGYDLARASGLAAGTLYPILGRLTDRGILESRWEEDPPVGRPRRHLYRLTRDGRAFAEQVAVAAQSTRPRPTSGSPRLAGGLA